MKSTGSLYARMIRDFIVLLLAGVLSGFLCILAAGRIVEHTDQFPDPSVLLEQSEYYETEQYQRIRIGSSLGKSGYFEVLDEKGKVLYCSDPSIENHYDEQDFEYIPDVDEEAAFSIEKMVNGSDENEYLIRKWQVMEDGSDQVKEIGITILNSRNRVVYSNMDADGKAISKHTVNMLMNNNSDRADTFLQKQRFETEDGEIRYLLIHTENIQTAENRSYRQAEAAAVLIFLPIVLAAIVFTAFEIMKHIQQPLSQLNEAMDRLGDGSRQQLPSDQVPSEFARVFDAFNQMKVRLKQSEQERLHLLEMEQETMADISHDLKTPVTVVRGYVYAMRDGLITAEQQPEIWNIILTKINRIDELLDQAADYSRLNHPDFHLNASCLDLSAFLRDYAAGLQKELDQAGYPLHKKIEEKEVLVKFDRLQMKRVLENIIANTLRYTPKGTEVTLQMTADKDSARILIGDNGPGIPAKIRDHVFEPFVIADEARTAGSGCGLGLSIARKIIEEHHGTMKLLKQSGTVYEIVLPLAEKEST